MIDWMQKHRKWLVITIWIATIAFIGAGFVGWGQFQFGKKASTIAKVGDIEVGIKEWQFYYNTLYNNLNARLGGKLDKATAERLGLKQLALTQAVNDALLKNFAKELHLYVTDEDVARKILQYFKSKKEYKEYLKISGKSTKEFEALLRGQILVEKLLAFLKLKAPKSAIRAVGSALFNSDNLSIQKITSNDLNISVNLDEVKAYWEKHKDKYKSPPEYKVGIVVIPLDKEVSEEVLREYYTQNRLKYKNEKGEILPFESAKRQLREDYLAKSLRKSAILAYKKLKASKGDYEIKTLTLNNDVIPAEKMQELIKNGALKPFVYKGRYITARLLEEVKPRVLSFEEAKVYVIRDYLNEKTALELQKAAKEALDNFKGKDIGWVTKYDYSKIPLKAELAEKFLLDLFTSENPKGYFLLPSNTPEVAVVYNIKEQKLIDMDKFNKNRDYVVKLTNSLMEDELLRDLLEYLKTKYNVEVYIKG